MITANLTNKQNNFSKILMFKFFYIVGMIFNLFRKQYYKLFYNQQQQINIELEYYNHDNAWAIITGATDGIGLAFAKKLFAQNWSIIIVSRNQEKIDNVIREHFWSASTVIGYMMDFSTCTYQDYEKFASTILKTRNIRLLINNAGVGFDNPEYFHLLDENKILQICKVNMEATMYMTKVVIKRMLINMYEKKGFVLNISSASGILQTSPLISVYGASKAFINHWTASMIIEYQGVIKFESLTPFYITSKLSGYKIPTFFIPSPETYVENAIQKIGKGKITQMGYYPHSFLINLLLLLPLKYRGQYIFDSLFDNIGTKDNHQPKSVTQQLQEQEELLLNLNNTQ